MLLIYSIRCVLFFKFLCSNSSVAKRINAIFIIFVACGHYSYWQLMFYEQKIMNIIAIEL